MRATTVLLCAWLLVPSPAWADVDPAVRELVAERGAAEVLVELTGPADATTLAALVAVGLRLTQVEDRPLAWAQFVHGSLDAGALGRVAALRSVRHIHAPIKRLLGLETSAQMVGLPAARGARPSSGLLFGQGQILGDVDSVVDVFHPVFFHADAGWYDWLDVNQDGKFEPGIDAIDLDRDGQPGPGETAMWLPAATIQFQYGPVPARPATFDPGLDWLYLDSNNNGIRDYGSPGFDDATPGLGEPLFVPDDCNRDGVLDRAERIVRLGSPKILAVYFADPDSPMPGHVFKRGVDLASLRPKLDAIPFSERRHATSVLSIALGDAPLQGRRQTGMAPAAEAVVGWTTVDLAKATTWVLTKHPDVLLEEGGAWTHVALDGSDGTSALIDEAVQEGTTAVCIAGNLGASQKHARLELSESAKASAGFVVPFGHAPHLAELTLHFRGTPMGSVQVRLPDGTMVPLDGATHAMDGVSVKTSHWTTTRNTDIAHASFIGQGSLPVGTWYVYVSVPTAVAGAGVDLWLSDDDSGWLTGVAWQASASSPASTLIAPAVADHCITVGAHADHLNADGVESWFPKGLLSNWSKPWAWSSRGPRMDGVAKPDLIAPDDPWAAVPPESGIVLEVPYAAMSPFSGTSGAGAHVAGAALLLAQADVRGDAARDALRAGAQHVPGGKPPDSQSGWGRLHVGTALGGLLEVLRPQVTVGVVPSEPVVGQAVTLSVGADPDGPTDALTAAWDDDIDGSWDMPAGPIAPRVLTFQNPGAHRTKVQISDGQGGVSELALVIDVRLPEANAVQDVALPGAQVPNSRASGRKSSGCDARGSAGHSVAWAVLVGSTLLTLLRRRWSPAPYSPAFAPVAHAGTARTRPRTGCAPCDAAACCPPPTSPCPRPCCSRPSGAP
jgi:hypothetical protein